MIARISPAKIYNTVLGYDDTGGTTAVSYPSPNDTLTRDVRHGNRDRNSIFGVIGVSIPFPVYILQATPKLRLISQDHDALSSLGGIFW